VPQANLQSDLQSETASGGHTRLSEDPQVSDHVAAPALQSETTLWARIGAAVAASRAYWTPPDIFTGRPASLEELAAYAKRAPWTHQRTGIVRAAGVGHYRVVGYPWTCVSRYGEWAAQRPMRLFAHLGGVKLLALTGPGDWAVHHIVYPAAQFAGHVFL
jgi:hypothetical protein